VVADPPIAILPLNYHKLTAAENSKVWGGKQSPKKEAVNDLCGFTPFPKQLNGFREAVPGAVT
jgi:hypothetical protein